MIFHMTQLISLGESMYHLRIDVIKLSHGSNVLREVQKESEKTGWTAGNFVTKVASTLLQPILSFNSTSSVPFDRSVPSSEILTIVFDTHSTHAIDREISSPNSSNVHLYNWQRSTYNTYLCIEIMQSLNSWFHEYILSEIAKCQVVVGWAREKVDVARNQLHFSQAWCLTWYVEAESTTNYNRVLIQVEGISNNSLVYFYPHKDHFIHNI